METLDMPDTGPLKMFDVDNAMALEDWRASGLGPCAAMLFERQVLGEFPHSEEVGVSCICMPLNVRCGIYYPVHDPPPPSPAVLLIVLLHHYRGVERTLPPIKGNI